MSTPSLLYVTSRTLYCPHCGLGVDATDETCPHWDYEEDPRSILLTAQPLDATSPELERHRNATGGGQ